MLPRPLALQNHCIAALAGGEVWSNSLLMKSMKPDHVTILVGSIDCSMPYYDALLPLLGFKKSKPHIWTDGDGFFLQFQEARAGTSPYERYAAGMNHIGFGAPSPHAVENVHSKMAEAGFDVPEIQRFKGATALFMKDPDGIRFEITHYPPGVAIVE